MGANIINKRTFGNLDLNFLFVIYIIKRIKGAAKEKEVMDNAVTNMCVCGRVRRRKAGNFFVFLQKRSFNPCSSVHAKEGVRRRGEKGDKEEKTR